MGGTAAGGYEHFAGRPGGTRYAVIQLLNPDWPAPARVYACSSLRSGGVSTGGYASANLGDHVGDDPRAVATNREQLRQCLPGRPQLAWLQQVHETAVVRADPGLVAVADAQFTDTVGVACTVLTADCLPVLFCDRDATRVAAAHAGWRGLVAGILEETVAALRVAPERLLVWLGPAISGRAFEVGSEVRATFLRGPGDSTALAAAFVPGPGDHWWADLYQLARLRLAVCGVTAIYGGDRCTYSEPRQFFSYRRDPVCGRQASLIHLCD